VRNEEPELDIDEAAVLAVFQTRAGVHFSEDFVISQAFALPRSARAALERLVTRGVLVREDCCPVHYRRAQDDVARSLRWQLLRTVLAVALGLSLAWGLQLLGVLHGSLLPVAVVVAISGLLPVVVLLGREHRYRAQRRVGRRNPGQSPPPRGGSGA
jgi:hypothetical protein